jgi:Reverse transcriptase (RNA-dependent DNA polymerase)
MSEEKDSLDSNETMEYVHRVPGMKVIPVHWIYSLKTDEQGKVLRFKARLVAKGCMQVLGVDVGEVFAPVSTYGARRAILCKAARDNLEVHQVDIKTAFLHGVLEEEVYVTQVSKMVIHG